GLNSDINGNLVVVNKHSSCTAKRHVTRAVDVVSSDGDLGNFRASRCSSNGHYLSIRLNSNVIESERPLNDRPAHSKSRVEVARRGGDGRAEKQQREQRQHGSRNYAISFSVSHSSPG